MAGRFTIETVYKAIDRITAPMKKMEFSVESFTKAVRRDFIRAQRSVDRFSRSVGGNLKQGIKRGLAAGLIVLGVGLAVAAQEFISFDKSIVGATAKFVDIDTTLPGVNKNLEELRLTARKVGAETQFSATEAAQGLEFLAMAGFTSAQAMKLLPSVVDLATVANVDLARATDISSDALGAFNLMSDDSTQLNKNLTRVMDVMAATVTATNTDMEQLFETIKKGAAPFTSAGQSMETFSAIAGRMAANAIKAGTAGRSMKNMILRLQDPTPKAAAALDKFGLSVEKLTKDGKLMDMVDILQLLEDGSKDLTTVQRNAALSALTGKESFAGFASILNEGVEKTRLLKESLDSSTGAAKRMANFMRGSLSVKLDILKSSLIELSFKFIEAFEKKGAGALEAVTKAVQNFDPGPVIDGFKTMLGVTETFLSVAKPMLPFIVGLVVAFKIYSAVMGLAALAQLTLNTAMGTTPIGAILIAIGLLIGLYLKFQPTLSSITTGVVTMSAAMLILNIAMAANPVLLIGSGTALLIGLFMKLTETTGSATNSFRFLGKTIIGSVLKPVIATVNVVEKLFTLMARIPVAGKAFQGLAIGLSTAKMDMKKLIETTELDKTGKSFITAPTRNMLGASEDSEADASGFPSLTPVLTQRETIQKSLEEKKSTNRVIIENQSNNPASHNGNSFNNGQSIMIPSSGG